MASSSLACIPEHLHARLWRCDQSCRLPQPCPSTGSVFHSLSGVDRKRPQQLVRPGNKAKLYDETWWSSAERLTASQLHLKSPSPKARPECRPTVASLCMLG